MTRGLGMYPKRLLSNIYVLANKMISITLLIQSLGLTDVVGCHLPPSSSLPYPADNLLSNIYCHLAPAVMGLSAQTIHDAVFIPNGWCPPCCFYQPSCNYSISRRLVNTWSKRGLIMPACMSKHDNANSMGIFCFMMLAYLAGRKYR